MVGADPDALERGAAQLRAAADEIDQQARTLPAELQAVWWMGQVATRFMQMLGSDHIPAMQSTTQFLRNAADELIRQAAEQRAVSTLEPVAVGGNGLGRSARSDDVDSDGPDRTRETQATDRGSVGDNNGTPAPLGSGFREGDLGVDLPPWDEDFQHGTESPTWRDRVDYAAWRAKAEAARLLGMDDATDMYLHYLDNSGEPKTFDMHEAYQEDSGMRNSINYEVASAALAADRLATDDGSWRITGEPRLNVEYPTTTNWQRTVGGYQQVTRATITRTGDEITMNVKVEGFDYYNFNQGQSDIASGTPDNANGRFTTVGLAKPFHSSGVFERTVTWKAGDPPSRDELSR